VCIEKKILIVMMVAVSILSFVFGYEFGKLRDCDISDEDIEKMYSELGRGDLRFLSENMTFKDAIHSFNTWKPWSGVVASAYVGRMCE